MLAKASLIIILHQLDAASQRLMLSLKCMVVCCFLLFVHAGCDDATNAGGCNFESALCTCVLQLYALHCQDLQH